MDNNKSDTLSQRKKAQQEFLELKRMQQGELVPEAVPEQIVPKTFKEKLINFWFHYKVHTLLLTALIIVLIVGISQCSNKEHYDGRVMLYINRVCADAEADIYKEFLTPYFTDTNDDGKVNVQVVNCAYTTDSTFDMSFTNALSSKLQAVISSEPDVQLFIVDDKKIEQLNKIPNNLDSFFIEKIEIPQELYDKLKESDFQYSQKLYLARRVVTGTNIENADKVEIFTKQAEEIMSQFKK